MADLGYTEKGEIGRAHKKDNEANQVEEVKEDSHGLHRHSKVGDSTLDSLDQEIEI